MDVIYSFGGWVRRRRKALDMTQDDLADCVGCSPVMIRKIESDERRPSEQITLRLAECFTLPADQHPVLLKVARGEHTVDQLATGFEAASPGIAKISQQTRRLPVQITHFVGRSAELRRVAERLARPDCRLLTLTGPGGIGKTRLAIQTAQKITGFADGIFYVPLAPLLSPDFLSMTIAHALDLTIPGAADPQAQLVSYLAEKELLLVLDNFEHLLDGARLAGELLEAAPRVRMLVTSRERLDLQGEWLYPVKGMSLPQNGDQPEPQKYDAVQLFMETAQRIEPDFALDDHWREIVRICRMVEGNPLGIELAAAQLHVLPCADIADRLQESLDVLASSFRNVPERHRSMRALFEHSWNMLDASLRDVLARLSVFRGGFTLVAAQQVAGADVLMLSSLVEKSLVRTSAEDRYDLHELLRQFSGEKLAADPASQADTEQAHSAFYSDFLNQREASLRGSAAQMALNEIDTELQNVHAAWQRALAYRRMRELEKSSNAFYDYCIARARFHEGRLAFQGVIDMFEALAGHDEGAQRVLTIALTRLAHFQFAGGDLSQARGMVEKSLAMARALGWREEEALALGIMGLYAHSIEEATMLFEQALVLQRAQEYSAGISDVCQNLGLAAAAQGHYDEASRYFREAVTIAEESGDDWQINVCLFYLGKIALLKGDYMEAQHCATEALAICTRHDFPLGTAEHAADLGILNVWKLGNYATAQRLLQESRDRLVEIGPAPWRTTTIVTFLATAYRELGEVDQAAYCYHEALSRTGSMTVGKAIMTAEILAHLGVLLTRMGEPEKALEMLVSTMKANESGSLTEHEVYPVALREIHIRIEEAMALLRLRDSLATLRAELEAHVGAEVVANAIATGDALSLEAIAAVALAV